MRKNKISNEDLVTRMLFVKVGTLMYHLTEKEAEQYKCCDFEFEARDENYIPRKLHTWVGENHKYKEKYHMEFSVPEYLQIPLNPETKI